MGLTMCEPEQPWEPKGYGCNGYYQDPKVGDLWPGESEQDFGYPCSNDGTTLAGKP